MPPAGLAASKLLAPPMGPGCTILRIVSSSDGPGYFPLPIHFLRPRAWGRQQRILLGFGLRPLRQSTLLLKLRFICGGGPGAGCRAGWAGGPRPAWVRACHRLGRSFLFSRCKSSSSSRTRPRRPSPALGQQGGCTGSSFDGAETAGDVRAHQAKRADEHQVAVEQAAAPAAWWRCCPSRTCSSGWSRRCRPDDGPGPACRNPPDPAAMNRLLAAFEGAEKTGAVSRGSRELWALGP